VLDVQNTDGFALLFSVRLFLSPALISAPPPLRDHGNYLGKRPTDAAPNQRSEVTLHSPTKLNR